MCFCELKVFVLSKTLNISSITSTSTNFRSCNYSHDLSTHRNYNYSRLLWGVSLLNFIHKVSVRTQQCKETGTVLKTSGNLI